MDDLVTFTTWGVHGLVAGQKLNISGITPTGYNVTGGTIVAAAANSNVFTVLGTTTAAYTSGGLITGTTSTGFIPDALGHDATTGQMSPAVYTTTNYWAVDDHSYSGTYSGTFPEAAPTAVIANISQWCATCHTRYMAGSGAWGVSSGDTTFTFRHRSQSGKENSPNCLQCHVAHGSNAAMSGTESAKVTTPNGAGAAGSSKLLRVDNRGTCNMCHNL